MKNFIFGILLAFAIIILPFSSTYAQAPFKYDNLYATLNVKDLCRMLQERNDIVMIDVRTAGEYSDTSQYTSLNQGRFKCAINIEIEGMEQNIDTLSPYKDKTIIFYCSHSQRSRRVSKLMIDNGFTNFYNLNGGMSYINQMSDHEFPCKSNYLTNALSFNFLSFDQSAQLIKENPDLVILDVRPSNQYESRDTLPENNVGRIKGAINIPYSEFPNYPEKLNNYKSAKILIYTESGDGDASRAASDLKKNGFKDVSIMLGGINGFVSSQVDLSMMVDNPKYTKLDPERTLKLLRSEANLTIFDCRPTDEFNNKMTGMPSYLNLGHIKNAVNIATLPVESISLPKDMKSPILICGGREGIIFADNLIQKGFNKVYYMGGLFGFVAAGFNLEGCKGVLEYMTDHEDLY